MNSNNSINNKIPTYDIVKENGIRTGISITSGDQTYTLDFVDWAKDFNGDGVAPEPGTQEYKELFDLFAELYVDIYNTPTNFVPNNPQNYSPTVDSTPGTLNWEDFGLSSYSQRGSLFGQTEPSPQTLDTGSKFNLGNGVTATLNWDVVNTGFAYDGSLYDAHVAYDARKRGNHQGYLRLGMDNMHNDPDDKLAVSLDFNQAVTGLSFEVLDVDQGLYFEDAVEIYADGVNILDMSGVNIDLGDNVKVSNKSYIDGFEGVRASSYGGGVGNSSDSANIGIDFGNTEVSQLDIVYSGTSAPESGFSHKQTIGISDLSFDVL